MSHFYGTINGKAKNESTQCGSKNSGLNIVAASWEGAVEVEIRYDEKNDCDMVSVKLIPWKSNGINRELYIGKISGEDSSEYDEKDNQHDYPEDYQDIEE